MRTVVITVIILIILTSCRSTKKIQTAISKRDTAIRVNVTPETNAQTSDSKK